MANQITGDLSPTARPDDVSPGSDDVTRAAGTSPTDVASTLDVFAPSWAAGARHRYAVLPLFDASRSYKLGSIVPIRLQLLDPQGENVSSASLVPTATRLVRKDAAPPLDIQDAGNSNPDGDLHYDSALQGYVFNLSTRNLALGTWDLCFAVPGDTATYHILFSIR